MSDLSQTRAVEHTTPASHDAVWSVLTDGWTYAAWVVGTSRIRDVDPSWPAVGARIHHSVGVWPLLLDDQTEVIDADPGRLLVLRAKGWPAGEAMVQLELHHADSGGSRIVIREDAVAGPLHRLAPRPLRQAAIVPRNIETLRRLAFLAQGRSL